MEDGIGKRMKNLRIRGMAKEVAIEPSSVTIRGFHKPAVCLGNGMEVVSMVNCVRRVLCFLGQKKSGQAIVKDQSTKNKSLIS